jgi:2-dehydropantoate 2-reductase
MKFGMLATFSGMTALTGHNAGEIRTNPETRKLIEASVRETIAVGKAAGGFLKDEDFASLMKTIDTNPAAMTSSMAHDRAAGKPLEVNYLSGAVVRIGERFGVEAPTHRFIARALAIDAAGKPRA